MISIQKSSLSALFLPVFGLLALGTALHLGGISRSIKTLYTSYSHIPTLGKEAAPEEITKLVRQALIAMKVPAQSLISIKKTDQTSCSTSWGIWINNGAGRLGPIEFVAFHEAAHVALGHFTQRIHEDVYPERARAQEVEADLLACKTLYNLGKKDIVIERLAQLTHAHNAGFQESDCEDHPSLKQNIEYIDQFLSSKGEMV